MRNNEHDYHIETVLLLPVHSVEFSMCVSKSDTLSKCSHESHEISLTTSVSCFSKNKNGL